MKKTILTITLLIFVLASGNSLAQFDYGFEFSKAGSAGLQFLKIGVGARETAMGEAVTGLVNDANAVFWNPAGIAYVQQREVMITHNRWLVDSKQNAAVFAYPVGSFVFALSAMNFSINEFEETTALLPDGTGRMVSAGDLLIGLTAARRFSDRLSIGLQVKFVQEKLDDYSISNFLFDVGTIYYTGFRKLTLGFALQHFGPDMKLVNQEFRSPLLFRISASDEIFSLDDYGLLAEVDLIHPTDNSEWVNAGMELRLLQYFKLRAGYRFENDLSKMSFGVGLQAPSVADINLKVDYSYVPSETVFSDIHRLTVGIGF